MPLFKKDESFPERSVLIIIVGTPFSYKTSLALTAKDPINFDFEKGSERAHGRAETYRIDSSWKEVEDDLAAGLLTPFKSAIIDTGGALIDDYLWDYGLVLKYTKNLMQNWGTVKDLFKKFVSKIRVSGLDLVVISHEKSKDKNDETVYDLDISGGGKQLLLRQADQIGFISKRDFKEGANIVTKTILTFWPTATIPFCKNVAGLPDIVLPDKNSPEWEGFLDREVIQKTRKAIASMSQEQVDALNLISDWRFSIDALEPGEDVTTFPAELLETYTEMLKIEPEHIKKQIAAYFTAHLAKVGFKWSTKANGFIPKEEKPVVDKPVDPAPANEPPADAAPVNNLKVEPTLPVINAEDQKAAAAAQAGTNGGSVVTKNPHTAQPKDDLFKPQE